LELSDDEEPDIVMAKEGKRAPSLHLYYRDKGAIGDVLVTDVCVPGEGVAKATYYCCFTVHSCLQIGPNDAILYGVTLISAFCRASDVISIVLSIH